MRAKTKAPGRHSSKGAAGSPRLTEEPVYSFLRITCDERGGCGLQLTAFVDRPISSDDASLIVPQFRDAARFIHDGLIREDSERDVLCKGFLRLTMDVSAAPIAMGSLPGTGART